MIQKSKLIAVVRERKDLSTLTDEEIIDILQVATDILPPIQRSKVLSAIDALKSEKYSANFADALYIAFNKEWFQWFKSALNHLDTPSGSLQP